MSKEKKEQKVITGSLHFTIAVKDLKKIQGGKKCSAVKILQKAFIEQLKGIDLTTLNKEE